MIGNLDYKLSETSNGEEHKETALVYRKDTVIPCVTVQPCGSLSWLGAELSWGSATITVYS